MSTFYCDRCKVRPVRSEYAICKACVVDEKRKKHATIDDVLQSAPFQVLIDDINNTHITQMKQTISEYEKQIETLNNEHIEYKNLCDKLRSDYQTIQSTLDDEQLKPPPLVRQTAQDLSQLVHVDNDEYECEVAKELAELGHVKLKPNASQVEIASKIKQNINQINKIKKKKAEFAKSEKLSRLSRGLSSNA